MQFNLDGVTHIYIPPAFELRHTKGEELALQLSVDSLDFLQHLLNAQAIVLDNVLSLEVLQQGQALFQFDTRLWVVCLAVRIRGGK